MESRLRRHFCLGCQPALLVVRELCLSPVQSRLLTFAAGVVDAPASLVSSRAVVEYGYIAWGGVGFTECSRRKLARADEVHY